MLRNEHGRSFLNDAVHGGGGTAGIKPHDIKKAGLWITINRLSLCHAIISAEALIP